MVVPSRFESMPYVVLEAAGCGQPMLSTRVGGIPEIFGPDSAALMEPGSVAAIESAIDSAFGQGAEELAARTARLRSRVMRDFSAEKMTDTVVGPIAGRSRRILAGGHRSRAQEPVRLSASRQNDASARIGQGYLKSSLSPDLSVNAWEENFTSCSRRERGMRDMTDTMTSAEAKIAAAADKKNLLWQN